MALSERRGHQCDFCLSWWHIGGGGAREGLLEYLSMAQSNAGNVGRAGDLSPNTVVQAVFIASVGWVAVVCVRLVKECVML